MVGVLNGEVKSGVIVGKSFMRLNVSGEGTEKGSIPFRSMEFRGVSGKVCKNKQFIVTEIELGGVSLVLAERPSLSCELGPFCAVVSSV